MTDEKYTHLPARDDGREQCVRCGEVFGGENASMGVVHTYGPVRHAGRGTEYDTVVESPPGEPLTHPDCYTELEAERNGEENHGLGEWA